MILVIPVIENKLAILSTEMDDEKNVRQKAEVGKMFISSPYGVLRARYGN